MTTGYDDTRAALLEAALGHVPFDGWSETTFAAAARDAGIEMDAARRVCPRGALDLAVAYHRAGDARMEKRLAEADLGEMRFRDRIAAAVRWRLEEVDKEVVRRSVTLMSLPQHTPECTKLLWETCDKIWTALGDTSDDINWYTKRGTLSGVYSSTVLYWLGDTTPDQRDTWEFLDRRIDNVMQFEKFKAKVRDNPLLRTVFAGPNWIFGKVRAPRKAPSDLPGRWAPRS
ncbi:ubiquinone biosynthesis protein COQ9 [Poseidonocella pacifica]|uniref:Ubiquinone biosynthesis protein COQ9 n=1 Tax=Poseidonocella pacifica TaxID=871651 RepID=A0A1I0XJI8_9RHOB|nr:COQ9 family protein [Poseidonocella pacifica]SFB01195.1 ubiquinone biosynthesis protein COQ9 [Poseidonocella pacifica]